MPKSERYYFYIATTFACLLLLSNVITAKLFRMPFTESYALPAGLLTYPLTFLLTDAVTEIWGAERSRRMIYVAFAINILSMVIIQISLHLPPDAVWMVEGNPYDYADVAAYQKAYEAVFSVNHVMIFGSLTAYLFGQLVDVWLFDRIRRVTGSRHLWLRNNVSTLVSQLLDTAIVGSFYCYIAMGLSFETGITIMLSSYLYKFAFSLCDTPFLYLVVGWLRKQLQENT